MFVVCLRLDFFPLRQAATAWMQHGTDATAAGFAPER
jgi:hypothetical protein